MERQSSCEPSKVTDGIPHIKLNLYSKYACSVAIIITLATVVSFDVVVEKSACEMDLRAWKCCDAERSLTYQAPSRSGDQDL